MRRTVKILFELTVCIIILLHIFSCNPLSGTDVLQGSDTIAPVITITSPADGDPYSATVTVTGRVSDDADDAGTAGRVDSVEYELVGTVFGGEVTMESDGNFSFQVSTSGITGMITLKITAVDWNDNESVIAIDLAAPKEITYFAFTTEVNDDLDQDAEGDISGTAITVSVPDGVDPGVLIAEFTTTGDEVKVDGELQVSGSTVNDFNSPVTYVVEANDNTTKEYTVTVAATPLPPTGLAAVPVNPSRIDLSWSDVAENETGYELQRKDDDGDFETPIDLGVNSFNYSDESLTGAAVYTYRLRAVNDDGPSAWVEVTIDAMPAAPNTVSAAVDGSTPVPIHLSWNDTSSITTGFEIQVKRNTGDYQPLATVDAETTDYYDIRALGGGVSWTYRIRAVNAGTASEWSGDSDTVTVTETSMIDTADSTGTVGRYSSIEIDSNGRPHISYYDGSTGNYKLKYTWWDGSAWNTETVEASTDHQLGLHTSLALDAQDRPHICYYDGGSYDLRYVRYDGAAWTGLENGSGPDTVDSTGFVGTYASIVLDGNGIPHISYADASNTYLKYAYWNGTGWTREDVYTTGSSAIYSSIALDSAGNPGIAFYDGTNEDLMYAYRDETWSDETVDGTGGVNIGKYPSLAFDGTVPHISYYDASNADLKYTWYNGSSWVGFASGSAPDTVDSTGSVGEYTSLALDASGYPHISYIDNSNDNLGYAFWNGSSWVLSTVDGSSYSVGYETSISLDADNRANISYYDYTNDYLKYYRDIEAPAE